MAANVIVQNGAMSGLGMMPAAGFMSMFDSILGGAKASADTFQQSAAGIINASNQARSQRLMVGAGIGLAGIAALGFVAYLATRK